MSKLHELLAAEPDLQSTFKLVTDEARKTFSDKQNMFIGWMRTLEMFEESDATKMEPELQNMEETVDKKLQYIGQHGAKYLNAVFQKEATNQVAKADLIVAGKTLAKDVPATFLLGLESKLKNIRAMYAAIPTLQPGIEWRRDEEIDAYRMVHPEVKMKTAKTFQHKVLYKATDKHPAQIEKWEENVNVGKYVRTVWCGAISSAEKSQLLGRLDTLIIEVKKARMRANDCEVVGHGNIGELILNYVHGG